ARLGDFDLDGRGCTEFWVGTAWRDIDPARGCCALADDALVHDAAQESAVGITSGELVVELCRGSHGSHRFDITKRRWQLHRSGCRCVRVDVVSRCVEAATGFQWTMSLMWPSRSSAQIGSTRRPVSIASIEGASTTPSRAVSAPSGRIWAQAKG